MIRSILDHGTRRRNFEYLVVTMTDGHTVTIQVFDAQRTNDATISSEAA
jgi:hypothetical protein